MKKKYPFDICYRNVIRMSELASKAFQSKKLSKVRCEKCYIINIRPKRRSQLSVLLVVYKIIWAVSKIYFFFQNVGKN